jgi:predicted nucleic acid-binding protein
LIVLDTTILVYSKGAEHQLRDPCRALIEAIAAGAIRATTTPEVIQEFVHVRSQRRARRDAAGLGRSFAELLSPLLTIEEQHLTAGLRLFERHTKLGAFDAVLVAAAIDTGAEALVSADVTFGQVRSLNHVVPGTPAFERLLAGGPS